MLSNNAKAVLCCLLLSFTLVAGEGKCVEVSQTAESNKKAFLPRYLINFWVTGLVTAVAVRNVDDGDFSDVSSILLLGAFFANSVTPVLLYQNHDSMTPFLMTMAATGLEVVAFEFMAKSIDGYVRNAARLLNWVIVMPTVSSILNHRIYVGRIRQRQFNLNLLQPAYLSYGNKMVPGVRIVQLSW